MAFKIMKNNDICMLFYTVSSFPKSPRRYIVLFLRFSRKPDYGDKMTQYLSVEALLLSLNVTILKTIMTFNYFDV